MKNKIIFRLSEFTNEEFNQIIKTSKDLIRRKYIAGINFLQSDTSLPQASIIIHFLHDSEKHIKEIESGIGEPHLVVPRYTYYTARPKYFLKPNFKEEYKNALFFNSEFRQISIEDAIRNPYGVTISNNELDLIIPLSNELRLPRFIKRLQNQDRKGPEPWIDPVIIVKSEDKLKTLENFVYKHFVSISRSKEEFYSVLTDGKRIKSLERYLDNVCNRSKIGKLRRSDIVFNLSHINEEFANYLDKIMNEPRVR